MLMEGHPVIETEGKPALLLVFQGEAGRVPLATIRRRTRSLT